MIDTIFHDYAGGKFEYWIYSDGDRIFVSTRWALSEIARKRARLVETAESKRARLENWN